MKIRQGCYLPALPNELLFHILEHLHSLDDLLSLMSTSKRLHDTYRYTSKHILRLASNSNNLLLRSAYPSLKFHFCLAIAASRLAAWAVQTEERQNHLHKILSGGMQSLLELAIEKVVVTLEDIKQACVFKKEILTPLIDEMVEQSSSHYGDFVRLECENLALVWLVYGELFHHWSSPFYKPTPDTAVENAPDNVITIPRVTRYRFVLYCIPDIATFSCCAIEPPKWFIEHDGIDFCQHGSFHLARNSLLKVTSWLDALNAEPETGIVEAHLKGCLFVTSVTVSGFIGLRVLRSSYGNNTAQKASNKDLIKQIRDQIDYFAPFLRANGDGRYTREYWASLPSDIAILRGDLPPRAGQQYKAICAAIRSDTVVEGVF